MKYLITGRAGSGKSAVNEELKRRGYDSHDADDYEGLAGWVDTKTKQPVKVDAGRYVDYSKVDWDWDETALKKILARPGDLFLCGSASNDLKFFGLFDKVFVLQPSPKTQLARLKNRPDAYAKDPRQQAETIEEQARFSKQAAARGAVIVNADRPLARVADDILEAVDG